MSMDTESEFYYPVELEFEKENEVCSPHDFDRLWIPLDS